MKFAKSSVHKIIVMLCGGLMLTASVARASIITVLNTADSGPGSLRTAIADAASGDTIQFAPAVLGQTILLTSGTLSINVNNLTINGMPGVTISGNQAVTDFSIANGLTVTLDDLTITGGKTASTGGGIFDNGATLTIENSFLTSNSANQGGGIYVNAGTLTVLNSTFNGNMATQGGAIYNNGGMVTLTNSAFLAKSDDIFNNAGTVTVTPLPAALPLFATGLGALGLLGLRRKRKA